MRIESDARCRVYAADLIALGEVLGAAPLSLVNEGQMVVSEDRDELAAITADRDAHCACDFNPQEIANWIKQDPSRIDLLNELVVTA